MARGKLETQVPVRLLRADKRSSTIEVMGVVLDLRLGEVRDVTVTNVFRDSGNAEAKLAKVREVVCDGS